MGSYNNIIKIEDMRKKVEEGDLLSAAQILDTMDIGKIKNISDLNLMSEVLKDNERYDEAAELYYKIYEKSPTRRSLANLVDISIKQGNLDDAKEYLKEYQNSSPDDFDSFIFRYKIDKIQGASYEQLIQTLLTLKKMERTEKWEYELAKVYYKAGMEEECIRECSDIILWFGEGVYVEKARMLRSYFSGETDRAKLMQELKCRAEGSDDDNTKEADSNEDIREDRPDTDSSDQLEEDICQGNSNFMAEHGVQEFEDGLKNDVRKILTGEYYDAKASREEAETFQTQTEEVNDNTWEAETESRMQDAYLEEVAATTEMIEDFVETDMEDSEAGQSTEPQEISIEEADDLLDQIGQHIGMSTDDIFDDYLQNVQVKKQIAECLAGILQNDERPVMLLITGKEGSDKTTLAKDMALFLSKAEMITSSKVAKITADKLNTIDINAKRETLRSCCIVIGGAGMLKGTTIDGLVELTQYLNGDAAIIFEEDENNLNKLVEEYPRFMDLIKYRIYLPA